METVKFNSRGENVKTLQQKLNAVGNYGLIPDGIFGSKTEAAVKDFQKKRGLTVDGIVGPKTWAALGVDVNANQRRIDKIIVHCAATPEGLNFTVEDIRRWHMKDRNFSDIGYHYVVYLDGSVHAGRPESLAGAHTSGQNANSIGVCYIGGNAKDGRTPKDTRTPEQKAGLIKILKELKAKYPNATIHGHREFAAKACPSFDAGKEYEGLF